jgi:hypothetical protein
LCWKDRAGSTKNFVAAESIVRVQTALAEVRIAPGEDADADAADVAVLEAGGSLDALTAFLHVSVAAAVLWTAKDLEGLCRCSQNATVGWWR